MYSFVDSMNLLPYLQGIKKEVREMKTFKVIYTNGHDPQERVMFVQALNESHAHTVAKQQNPDVMGIIMVTER